MSIGLLLLISACGTTPTAPGTNLEAAATQDGGSSASLLQAFPPAEGLVGASGAEGWGALALDQCRSMPVQLLEVVNTNSSGAGSLDQAVRDVRSDRFSFIIFRTGGHIVTPPDGIRLASSCVYFAGQTASGEGIAIEGRATGFWFRAGEEKIQDVVMRYLRFRGKAGLTKNNLIIAKGDRIVLDHMSFSWADNYLLALLRYGSTSYSGPISNVSIQNSIVSEAFAVHPTAIVISSDGSLKEARTIDLTNISLHRNLIAHNSHRNPMTAADNALVANNVISNWRLGAGMMNRRGRVDWVNNYGKAGPMTDEVNTYVVNPYCDELGGNFSVFAAGNVGPRSSNAAGNNWLDPTRQVACYRGTGDYDGQAVTADWRRETEQDWRFESDRVPYPVAIRTANDAYHAVLSDVGVNWLLDCDGRWIPALDPVDARVISETLDGTGVSSPPENETQVGGYPSYDRGTPCDDLDRDGLPDGWERRFSDCDTCADPAARGRDGYLVIEHYLNGTTP